MAALVHLRQNPPTPLHHIVDAVLGVNESVLVPQNQRITQIGITIIICPYSMLSDRDQKLDPKDASVKIATLRFPAGHDVDLKHQLNSKKITDLFMSIHQEQKGSGYYFVANLMVRSCDRANTSKERVNSVECTGGPKEAIDFLKQLIVETE